MTLEDMIRQEMESYAVMIQRLYPGYKGGCRKSRIDNSFCGLFGSDSQFKSFERNCPDWKHCFGERFRQAYIEPTLKKDGIT